MRRDGQRVTLIMAAGPGYFHRPFAMNQRSSRSRRLVGAFQVLRDDEDMRTMGIGLSHQDRRAVFDQAVPSCRRRPGPRRTRLWETTSSTSTYGRTLSHTPNGSAGGHRESRAHRD